MMTRIFALFVLMVLIISKNPLMSPFSKEGHRGIKQGVIEKEVFSILSNLAIAEEAPETVSLNVRGMACSQCTKRVEGELKKINGVKNAEANLKEAKVKITFEKGKVSAEQLAEAINNMGYWVEKK